MPKLKIILQSNILLFILIVISLLILIFNNLYIDHVSIYNNNPTFSGNIIDYLIDGDKLTFKLNAKEDLIGTYYFKDEAEKNYYIDNLKYGASVLISATLSEPNNNTIPSAFNYKMYLYHNYIYKTLKVTGINIIGESHTIINGIKNYIYAKLKKVSGYEYLKAFILGDKREIDAETFSEYRNLGVTHLFAISGMHIGLFSTVLLFLLKKLHLNNNVSLIITLIVLGIYGFITCFPASIRRTYLLFLLITLNSIFKLEIKTSHLLFFTIFINILIKPFIVYDIGFIYSCLTTFGLIINSNLLNKGNYFNKVLKVSIIAFLYSLPVTINNFNEINFLTPLNNLIIVPLISLIIYPLSLLTFLFPFLNPLLNISVNILNFLSAILNTINIFKINIISLSWYWILLYYIILFVSLKSQKYYLNIVIILILLINIILPLLDSSAYIYYLDVGQGDSIIIITPNHKKALMLDTGGKTYQKEELWQHKNNIYHISDNSISFLKSLGINCIDQLILSHGDADHMGESSNIVNNFKVKNVIFNIDSYNNLENELIKILNQKKINYAKGSNTLTLNDIQLQFLNTKTYDNENDNSNVIYFNYNKYKFLFMGDAGINREKDIMSNYKLSNVDFLKIGHHGSNTSSSAEFINSINPKYSLISVGKNNRYGHPKESVLDTLKNSKVYRTDHDGSIEIKINKSGYKISTCRP